MKFAIDKHHRDFFQKFGYIEFENILSSDQTAQFNQAVDQSSAHQLAVSEQRLGHLTSEKMFSKSRDLWRYNETLSKLTFLPRLGELASDIIEKKPIRLGYTQFFPRRPENVDSFDKDKSPYLHFLRQKTNLHSISCVSNVLCGLMLSLSEPSQAFQKKDPAETGLDIFSDKSGSAIFFRPEVEFDLEHLFDHVGQRYYLIVYTHNVSNYLPCPKDPFDYVLKQVGYVLNDKLSDRLNPIVYR